MDRAKKQQLIELWHERFGKARSVVLTNFQGLDAAQMFALRKKCHDAKVDYVVLKNTLARLALKGTAFESLGEKLRGPIGWVVSYEDEVSAAKVAAEYAKEVDKFQIIMGAVEGKELSEKEVLELAKMPGKNDLRAQLLSVLQAVPAKFVATLNEIPAGLARVIDAYRSAKESA